MHSETNSIIDERVLCKMLHSNMLQLHTNAIHLRDCLKTPRLCFCLECTQSNCFALVTLGQRFIWQSEWMRVSEVSFNVCWSQNVWILFVTELAGFYFYRLIEVFNGWNYYWKWARPLETLRRLKWWNCNQRHLNMLYWMFLCFFFKYETHYSNVFK